MCFSKECFTLALRKYFFLEDKQLRWTVRAGGSQVITGICSWSKKNKPANEVTQNLFSKELYAGSIISVFQLPSCSN